MLWHSLMEQEISYESLLFNIKKYKDDEFAEMMDAMRKGMEELLRNTLPKEQVSIAQYQLMPGSSAGK